MNPEELEDNIYFNSFDNISLIYIDDLIDKLYMGYIEGGKVKFTSVIMVTAKFNDMASILTDENYEGIEHLEEKKKKNNAEKFLIFLYNLINSHEIGDKPENILYELTLGISDIITESKAMGISEINKDNINNITDKAIKDKLKKLSEEITIEKNSKLYLVTEGEKQIIQVTNNEFLKDGLYYERTVENSKTGETKVYHDFIGNILINKLTLTYDKLNLFNPVVSIEYINTTINQKVKLTKKPYEEIASNIVNNRLIDSNSQGVEFLLNKIWVNGINSTDDRVNFITAESDLLKDGFFMDMENNKVLSNNVFNDLETSKEDISKAIKLFNEIIRYRRTAIPNDCTLFRFMLWSPFAFCLKQLGITDGLYSMVLWGVTDTSKTGSSIIFSNLYTDKETTLQKANTQSAIGTRLGENTFPLILDEAKDNLINPNDEEFNKNIVTDIVGRAVKDRANNNLMQDFPALRLTVRTLNPKIEFKDEFLKRHKVLQYDTSMKVNDKEKEEFNKKFRPKAPNTPLKQLRHLGRAFANKFIPYLENQSDELYNLEDLTIKILGEIEKECNTEFNSNVTIKQKITAQSTDKASIIQNGLNKMFTKAYKIPYTQNGYTGQDFINAVDLGAIKWLGYQPRNELFLIKVSDFETDISSIIGEYLPTAEIMKLLNIDYEYKERAKFKNNSVPCVRLDKYNLTYKLFNINIYTSNELEELQRLEEEKEQREEEANKILARKPI